MTLQAGPPRSGYSSCGTDPAADVGVVAEVRRLIVAERRTRVVVGMLQVFLADQADDGGPIAYKWQRIFATHRCAPHPHLPPAFCGPSPDRL